ncbi:MAG: hypothetical protein LBH00_10485 [Planctomycetaceae bacterium]|jgi:hypothetical protein|nr:hypothetical protein [Planctomycetaceae bacterium]
MAVKDFLAGSLFRFLFSGEGRRLCRICPKKQCGQERRRKHKFYPLPFQCRNDPNLL